jgi:hypothetical protein
VYPATADANSASLACNASVAYVDIAIACGEIEASKIAQSDVMASSIVIHCCISNGGIGAAVDVSEK